MSRSPEAPVDKLVALVNELWRYRLAAMMQTARVRESMDGLRARRAEIPWPNSGRPAEPGPPKGRRR